MAQRRLLSRSLGCSEKFTAVPVIAGKGLAEFAQLLYCLMIPHADDYGRMRDGAKGIKLSVLPDSARPVGDFESALLVLAAAGLIIRYESKGDRVIQITRFKEEQPGLRLDRSAKPRWDDPPEIPKEISNTGNIPAVPGKSSLSELNLSEEKRTRTAVADAPAPPSPVPGLMKRYHDGFFSLVGTKPEINGPKDGAILKRLAKAHGEAEVAGCIDQMFASSDPFIVGSGYTIGVLKSQFNKLQIERRGRQKPQSGGWKPPED